MAIDWDRRAAEDAEIGAAYQALRPANVGRQRDAGAKLSYVGMLLVPLYKDASVNGVFAASSTAAARGEFEAHQGLTVRDGAVGGTTDIRPLNGISAGNVSAIIAMVGGVSTGGLTGALAAVAQATTGMVGKPPGQITLGEAAAVLKQLGVRI